MPAHDAKVTSCYLLIATHLDWDPHTDSREIVKTLGKAGFWLASRFTPYRSAYKDGDLVLLYAAGDKARVLLGDAVIAGVTVDANSRQKAVAEKLGLEGFREAIPLRSVRMWAEPVLLKPLVHDLSFIKDKHNWGLNLRQAAARIPHDDYAAILKAAQLTEPR